MKIKSSLIDLVNGIKILAKGSDPNAVGDKKLAYMSRIVQGQIDVYGVPAVRTQVIKSIESDFNGKAKKGRSELDKMMQNAFATPDYMKMLYRLGLDETHIRMAAMQALKKAGQEWRANEQK